MTSRTIFEPFRIHSVEQLRITTEAQRRVAIEAAGLNLFKVQARDVLIDVIEIGAEIAERAADLRGLQMTSEPPSLRQFTAQFEQVPLKDG